MDGYQQVKFEVRKWQSGDCFYCPVCGRFIQFDPALEGFFCTLDRIELLPYIKMFKVESLFTQ